MRVSKEYRPTDEELSGRILAIARDHFLRAGVARTTMDEIAHHAGMSKKTVYKLYPSKEGLLRTIVGGFLTEIHRSIRTIVESDHPVIVRLHSIMTLLAERIGMIGSPMMVDIQRYHPAIWNEFVAFRRERIATEFRALIDGGIKEGVIRSDISADILLGAFTGAVEYLLVPSSIVHARSTGPDTLKGILSLFLDGVLTPAGRSAAGRATPEHNDAMKMFHQQQSHHHPNKDLP